MPADLRITMLLQDAQDKLLNALDLSANAEPADRQLCGEVAWAYMKAHRALETARRLSQTAAEL